MLKQARWLTHTSLNLVAHTAYTDHCHHTKTGSREKRIFMLVSHGMYTLYALGV